ncbi:Sporulation integral membrane protein YlbJ [compost metagenome]
MLAIAHYGGAILVGLLMRFHGSKSPVMVSSGPHKMNIWKRAFESMHMARVQDGRPIGILLSQAIQHSLSLVFVVGGLVVFFSVVLEVLTAGNIMEAFYSVIQFFLRLTGFPSELSEAVMNGLFEVTIGAKAAGSAGANIALISKLAIAAFVLSWAGLSVHAQIVSLISHTNMRYAPFIIARLLHGLFAAAIILIIWEPLQPLRGQLEAFLPEFQVASPLTSFLHIVVPSSGLVFISTIVVIVVLYLVHFLFTSMYRKLSRNSVKP